jgi:hypothetical protein
VLGCARKFEDLQAAAENTTLPALEPIERAPRLPADEVAAEEAADPKHKAQSVASDLRSALDL